MRKIKVLLITVICGFILGFIIFSNYYGIAEKSLLEVSEKAAFFAVIVGSIPFVWYVLGGLFWLLFGGVTDDLEDSSNSGGITSSNYDGGYSSGGDGGSGGGCD